MKWMITVNSLFMVFSLLLAVSAFSLGIFGSARSHESKSVKSREIGTEKKPPAQMVASIPLNSYAMNDTSAKDDDSHR